MATGTVVQRIGEATVDRRYAFTLTGMFAAGWLAISANALLPSPLLPLIRQEFDLSGTQTGLVTAAFTLPYVLMQVPAGILADRFGPKRVLVVMLLISALALGGIGLLATSLFALVGFAVVHRLGAGVFYPSTFGMTLSSLPRSLRGVGTAALSGGMALGCAVGMGIAVPLAELGGSWRFPFAVMAVVMLLLPFAVLGLVRGGQRINAARASGLGRPLRDGRLRLLFALGMCSNFGFATPMPDARPTSAAFARAPAASAGPSSPAPRPGRRDR